MFNPIRRYVASIVTEHLDERLEAGIDVGTGTTSIRDDRVHISANIPAYQLEGTETNGENLSLRENAGTLELYDETAAALAGTWDLSPPLENASLAAVDGTRNLQPEGAQAGLAADATGIKYEGDMRQRIDSTILNSARSVYIEAATNSSAGDETVSVEVYDDTALAVAASLDVVGGAARARSSDISASLVAGNEVHVRWNVTTASATAGATVDAVGARLIVE